MSTCNRLDLQTLGYQLIMPKNLPGHRFRVQGTWGLALFFILKIGSKLGNRCLELRGVKKLNQSPKYEKVKWH